MVKKSEKKRIEKGIHERRVGGFILLIVGLTFLSSTTGFLGWAYSWPIILIGIGIVLLTTKPEECC